MAEMLQERFSSEKHLDISERHVHLSQRNSAAAFLAQDIKGPRQVLVDAKAATEAMEKQRAFGYDTVVYLDGNLDNGVEDHFQACTKIDRESGAAPILPAMYPTKRISDVKDAPLMQEPLMVKELIQRTRPYPQLANIVLELEAKVAESEKAIAAYDKLGEELALCAVREETAKRNLRDQYRLNYLHAQERLGVRTAELMFPKFRNNPKRTEPQPPADQPAAS
jgi:hypothetical protein